jgi:NTE family protein
VQRLQARAASPPVDIVHLICRHKRYHRGSKDYEFSRASVLEHWQAG